MPEVNSYPRFFAPKTIHPDCPLFVFLPGMDGTGQLLRTQTDDLEKCFDVRCLVLPQDDWRDWDSLSRACLDLIEQEQVHRPHRPVYLCGESFGGCLALKVALREPKLFERIILVNPASSYRRRPLFHCAARFTRWMPESLYRSSALGLLPFLSALRCIAPSDRRTLFDAMKSVPPKTVYWRLSLLEVFEVSEEELSRLTQPVLLVASAADRLLPSVAEAKSLASALPNSQLVVLPNSGHTCLLEKEMDLSEILNSQNFLEFEAAQKLLTS
ncbi:MAG: alpha/beta hydrolase [Cyanobacteria bacterium QS_7_48_42]|nr:MAG: alpha/beta hydrolase [Cyanobacteria bacterium QS_7_48_42]